MALKQFKIESFLSLVANLRYSFILIWVNSVTNICEQFHLVFTHYDNIQMILKKILQDRRTATFLGAF